jgi:hypothetical protein
MRSLVHTALLLALAAPAIAQEPTEEQKHDALMRAYHQNGDSMVGWGSIDMTAPRKVTTERITPDAPDAKAEQSNETDKLQQKWVRLRGNRKLANNVCEDHGMHKVLSNGGRSWHCKK